MFSIFTSKDRLQNDNPSLSLFPKQGCQISKAGPVSAVEKKTATRVHAVCSKLIDVTYMYMYT